MWQKLLRLITYGKNYRLITCDKNYIDLLHVAILSSICYNDMIGLLSVDRDQEIQCEVMDRLLQTILREVSRISIRDYTLIVNKNQSVQC